MGMNALTIARPVTSPSNLHRRLLCPGSARLEAKQSPDDSYDARLGRLFHRYFTNPNLDRAFLSPDQRDLLERSDRLLQEVLDKLEAPSTTLDVRVEETIRSADSRLTGTPDQVFFWGKKTLVNDLKSGFAIVERAELNLQLRGYAVLVADNYAIDHVFVSILQPRLWSPSERITVARYESGDIIKARKQINDILDKTEEKKAQLVAGEDQCRYCRAKLVCPAFRKALALPLKHFKNELDLSKAAREAFITQRIKACNDDQLESVRDACALARFVADAADAEARDRIRDGRFAKFCLGKESEVRNITDVGRAIAMLAVSGVATRQELYALCSLPLRDLEERYRSKHQGMTWDKARDKINKVLASVMSREPRQAKILRKKK